MIIIIKKCMYQRWWWFPAKSEKKAKFIFGKQLFSWCIDSLTSLTSNLFSIITSHSHIFAHACQNTAWKVCKYGVFPRSYFRIQPEYRKIRTRKNPVFGHFHAVKIEDNSWRKQLSGILRTIYYYESTK